MKQLCFALTACVTWLSYFATPSDVLSEDASSACSGADCGSCVTAACGWCEETQACVDGNQFGPVGGGCTYTYAATPEQCPRASSDACANMASCGPCLANGVVTSGGGVSCGWCAGPGGCAAGTPAGPAAGSAACSGEWLFAPTAGDSGAACAVPGSLGSTPTSSATPSTTVGSLATPSATATSTLAIIPGATATDAAYSQTLGGTPTALSGAPQNDPLSAERVVDARYSDLIWALTALAACGGAAFLAWALWRHMRMGRESGEDASEWMQRKVGASSAVYPARTPAMAVVRNPLGAKRKWRASSGGSVTGHCRHA